MCCSTRCAATKIGKILDTRWVASIYRTVKAVWNFCPALSKHFQEASNDRNRDIKERKKYNGLLTKLNGKAFVSDLAIMHDALLAIKDLSESWQKRDIG